MTTTKTKILIIEDEQIILSLLEEYFTSMGYSVSLAPSGKAGVAMARSGTFDVALIDIKLPDANGVDILREFKDRYPDMVSCIMTGQGRYEDVVEVLKAGADDFFIKPLILEELSHGIEETLSKRRLQKELRESVASLQAAYEFSDKILNSMRDAISIIDVKDMIIVKVNKAFLEEYGGPEEEVIGRPCYEISHKLTDKCKPPDHICPLDDLLKNGSYSMVEHLHYDNAGNRIFVEVAVSPIYDRDGNITQIVHSSRDITERKRTELELQRQHEKLNEMFHKVEAAKQEWEATMDCIQDMIILVDGQGLIRRCNQAAGDFFNISSREVIGRSWVELCKNSGMLLPARTGEEEAQHLPSGRWFSVKKYRYGGDGGISSDHGLVQQVVTFHEVSEIKQISAELKRKNKEVDSNRLKLQEALDSLSVLIQRVAHHEDFTVHYQNSDLKRCYETKQCSRKDCPCYGKDPMRCWQVAGTFCRDEVQGEFASKIGDCTLCEVYREATSNPIFLIGEQFNNMMHILEAKNKELLDAYEQLKTTQAKILQSEKMASIGQLAAGVAHEINNPMGFISSNIRTLDKYVGRLVKFIDAQSEVLGTLQALDRVADTRKKLKLDYIIEDTRDLIEESLDGAERVKKIVQNLKTFSRVDQAEEKMADINECLETTLNIVWNELKYKCVLKKDYGDLPYTRCHPQQLNQVFMNLLVNAAQAIDEQGEITITTRQDNGTIRVVITDTGRGIPAAKLDKIFEPFFTTKEVGKGTGLGLSIVYDIIEQHNGEITVQSQEGRGTTFTVTIPVVGGNDE